MARSADWIARLRLVTGLILFTFVSTHLLNHSLGLISLDAQEAGRTWFLGFWRSLPGATVLLTAAALHLTLVLGRQVLRTTMRMPTWEIVRLLLGLCTLFFVTVHGLETYGMNLHAGLKDTYFYVLLYIWPDAWWRQTILIALAWSHGCMGIHFWLRMRPWYRRWVPLLYTVALLLPVLAWLGAWNGAADAKAEVLAQRAQAPAAASPSDGYGDYGSGSSSSGAYGDYGSGSGGGSDYGSYGDYGSGGGSGGGEYGSGGSGAGSDYGGTGDYGSYGGSAAGGGQAGSGEARYLLFGYDESGGVALLSKQGLATRYYAQEVGLILAAVLVVGVFTLRWGLQVWRRRRGVVRVRYPDGRVSSVPLGATVLEASRAAGIPHASVCGGRARCTTCRVRIEAGLEGLPPPGERERRALERIGAPTAVRLACQIRPRADLAVSTLVAPNARASQAGPYDQFVFGAEQEIAVLFCDLRGFTSLSEGKLPYDVVHLLNQYFQAMGAVIEAEGGHLDKFIGDGIMALFGIQSGLERGCRDALAATRAMAGRLEVLNARLTAELGQPLRMGMGIHAGPAIVGRMGYRQATTLTAIGETVNVASRLESATKEHGVQLIASAAVAAHAGGALEGFERKAIPIRGVSEPLPVVLVPAAGDLPDLRDAGPARQSTLTQASE
ncbi:MAG TPA: adenylate/guanylate cyclase domain-containing protein [bacterium]|nr:adenylate/guanylate cyclase domain-containing protein [bacterium]